MNLGRRHVVSNATLIAVKAAFQFNMHLEMSSNYLLSPAKLYAAVIQCTSRLTHVHVGAPNDG
jgi:hypothetical protein